MYQGALTLTECQVLTKAAPPTMDRGERTQRKARELRTGREHSPVITMGTTDLTWGYELKLLSSKSKERQ